MNASIRCHGFLRRLHRGTVLVRPGKEKRQLSRPLDPSDLAFARGVAISVPMVELGIADELERRCIGGEFVGPDCLRYVVDCRSDRAGDQSEGGRKAPASECGSPYLSSLLRSQCALV